jgi:hypothetical protein
MRSLAIVALIFAAGPAQADHWRPAPGATIQLQYTGEAIDRSVAAEIYNLDLFETPPELIAALQAEGRRVICYMSVGTREDWRPDVASFSAAVVGAAYPQWPGESWLDLRAIDALAPAMKARLDLALAKGCDGIDPDNLDGYETASGFPLAREDVVAFMRWLSGEARGRGLGLGLKNGADLWPDLQGQVDWVLIEDCAAQGWCEAFRPAREAGLAVFEIEYTDQDLDWPQVCAKAAALGFSAIRKHRNLDAYRERCP